MWRKTPITAVPVSMTPPTIGCCPLKGRPPENTLKSSILSPLQMWRLKIPILGAILQTVVGISLSAEDEPYRKTCPPPWGEEVWCSTLEVGHNRLTPYSGHKGCHGGIRTLWWPCRWGWRNGSELFDSLCTRPRLQATILIGIYNVTCIPLTLHIISSVQTEWEMISP